MNVLVTGGAGYIGSHTCVELLEAGHQVIVLDNLYNASEEALNRVREITGKPVKFYKGDIADAPLLEKIFEEDKPDVCIHFAGLKAVGESVEKPLEYYQNNIAGTLNLLLVMRKYNMKNMIFSSSATVYGDPALWICIVRIMTGTLSCSVISIRSEHIRVVKWERIQMASRTI